MFKIIILQIVVSAAIAGAGPIYPGVSYGGIGTSTVSVRRTSVITPGIYSGGDMPGMGVGTVVSSVYGTRTMGLAPLVDEKSASKVEGRKENDSAINKAEIPVDEDVEVVKSINGASPIGQLRTGASRGRSSSRKTGSEASVKESQISTPPESKSSPSSIQKRSSGPL